MGERGGQEEEGEEEGGCGSRSGWLLASTCQQFFVALANLTSNRFLILQWATAGLGASGGQGVCQGGGGRGKWSMRNKLCTLCGVENSCQ